MTETEALRGIRYATAFFFQLACWSFAIWYPLGISGTLAYYAFVEGDFGCLLLFAGAGSLFFIGTGWVCSRIAKALLADRMWATVTAAIAGVFVALACFYSVVFKPAEALGYVSKGIGFAVWSVVLIVVAVRSRYGQSH